MSSSVEHQRPRGMIANLTAKLAWRRKHQVLDRFFKVMQPKAGQVVLDLGGPSHDGGRLSDFFSQVIVVNLHAEVLSGELFERRSYSQHSFVVGDGCNLPFRSRSVDFIFCDQVIEHVPKQLRPKFVGSIRRVAAQGFLISTPNYHFPFEPHYQMPCIQYLPEQFRKQIVSHVRLGWMDAKSYHVIELLTAAELKAMLPSGTVEGFSFGPWMPETLVAWQKFEEPNR
jgi:ubiquinone/menaquinone biosynthesis C-methylase UbiE